MVEWGGVGVEGWGVYCCYAKMNGTFGGEEKIGKEGRVSPRETDRETDTTDRGDRQTDNTSIHPSIHPNKQTHDKSNKAGVPRGSGPAWR